MRAPVTNKVKHPARFSDPILDVIRAMIRDRDITGVVLDPFAGVGRVHELDNGRLLTVGVELEREWAEQHTRTICGDSRDLRALGFDDGDVDCVVTSPAYGNRMADSHTPSPADTSKRITYTHVLGRKLTPGNSGAMPWGNEYRELHMAVWRECLRTLRDGGWFVLNVKNHIRAGVEVDVVGWHRTVLSVLGVEWLEEVMVPGKGMGYGANGEVRVGGEIVMIGRKRSGNG